MKKIIFLVFVVFGSVLLAGCRTTRKPFQSAAEVDPIPGGGTDWTAAVDRSRKSLVSPPEKIPWITGMMLNSAERKFGKELMPGRVLTWSTDLGIASGFLEKYVEKGAGDVLDPRLVYLLRMQVSYYVSCPFAIDVNSWKYRDYGITLEEIEALQGKRSIRGVESFSDRECAALEYAVSLSKTPVCFDGQLLEDMRRLFSPEEVVAVAALAAKVNYWARFIEAMRIKPAGYSNDPVLDIEKYSTFGCPVKDTDF